MKFVAKWRWTSEDYKVLSDAYKRLTSTRRLTKIVFIALIVLCVLAMGLFFWKGDPGIGGHLVFYILVVFAIKFIFIPWVRRRSYVQQNLDGVEFMLEADEESVDIKSTLAEANYQWDFIEHVTFHDGYTILWPDLIQGIPVPDRGFSSLDDARRFAQFARDKISNPQTEDLA